MRTKESIVSARGQDVAMTTTRLGQYGSEAFVPGVGAIVRCTAGSVELSVSLKSHRLERGGVIIIFPDDVVAITRRSADFEAEVLSYSPAVLREASLQLEHTVYSLLRGDRCRSDSAIVTTIHERMFGLLRVYFEQTDCNCLERLVVLQLKAFFIGFYDYISRFPNQAVAFGTNSRKEHLFNGFMELVTENYRKVRTVAEYASMLSITPKYLNTIVRAQTGETAKSIIDHYVVLQLKQRLRAGGCSVKQLSCEFNFSDDSFFCRYFKAHTGLTPQQFGQRRT